MKNPCEDMWLEKEKEDWEKEGYEPLPDLYLLSCPECMAIVRKDLWFLHRDWHEEQRAWISTD